MRRVVWKAIGKDGRTRIELTECPGRVLSRNREALDVVIWWMNSSTWGDMAGEPVGPPEWPRPGGMLRQHANLVEAVSICRSEYSHVPHGEPAKR